MPVINHVKREINAKIVYFGPPFAGKTTSINYIHSKLKPDCRGELKSVGSRDDRLHFFDFMPHEIGSVEGYRVRFHVYTVTGEVASPATWKMVLKGADGVVFIADAAAEGREGNRKHLELLREQLEISGRLPSDIPLVVQVNKDDLVPKDSMEEAAGFFRKQGIEPVFSSAKSGEGVLAAISLLVKNIMKEIRSEWVQVLEPEPLDEEVSNLPTPDPDEKFRDEDFFAPTRPQAGVGVSVDRTENFAGATVEVTGNPEQMAGAAIALPLSIILADGTRVPLRITFTIDLPGKE